MQDNDSQRQPTGDRMPDYMPEACFARRVRERREALGWSQAYLAEWLQKGQGIKLDPTAITRIERGDRKVSLNEAVGLATILGTDMDSMIALDPGDLTEQITHAHIRHQNALWAKQYWEKEAEWRGARLAELREQYAKWKAQQEAVQKFLFEDQTEEADD